MTIKPDYAAFDGIIFDVDGTLWDSTPLVADAYNIIFEKEGEDKRVTADDLRQLFGMPMNVIFEQLFPDKDKETRKSLADKALDLENELLSKNYAEYYPQTKETLLRLSKKIPLFIVSNCQCGYIEIVIEGAKLENIIKDFLCFGDTGTSKGRTILTLMERNGLKNPIYVGDIQGDADACAEAKIPIIHAAYGFGKIENPYGSIKALSELTELFDC